MSSNLDYVVSTLNDGDTVLAEFVSTTHGRYSVDGKVSRKTGAGGHKYVKVGGVLIAATPFQNASLGVRPVATLNSITVVARAAQPFYSNRTLDRQPKNGDVAATLYGDRYYFDGVHFHGVGFKPNKPRTVAEFKTAWGLSRLVSEAVAL